MNNDGKHEDYVLSIADKYVCTIKKKTYMHALAYSPIVIWIFVVFHKIFMEKLNCKGWTLYTDWLKIYLEKYGYDLSVTSTFDYQL